MYILRVYIITEYEIEADTRKEAEERLYTKYCEQSSEWLEKTTLRKKPPPRDKGKPNL